MKRFIFSAIVILSTLFLIPSLHSFTQSQTINIEEKDVLYELPYPGLVPGHPLYPLKSLRDHLLLFTTRDNYKKAQLYLHISDKNMSSALKLAGEGKEQLATEQLAKAEDQFLRIPDLLVSIKEQGGSYPSEFTAELIQSNAKHREVITEVMKKTTQTEIDTVDTLLNKNEEARKKLEKL